MDTKLKNSKEKYYISGIVILIIMMLSIIMVSLYERIDSIAKDSNQGTRYEYIQHDLYKSNFVLNKLLIEKETGKSVNYSDLYLSEKVKKNTDTLLVYEEQFKNLKTRLTNELKNLDYLIIDNLNNEKLTNTKQDLSLLINSNIKNQDILNYYNYYIVIEFDSEGNVNIKNTNQYGYNYYSNKNGNLKGYLGLDYEEEIINPKNVTIVYGIPKNLSYSDDDIYYNSLNIGNWVYGDALAPYAIIIYAVVILMSLIISYKKSKEDKIISKLLNIPLEILATLIISITACVSLSPEIIYGTLYNTEVINGLKIYGLSESVSRYGLYIINVIYWIALLFSAFIAISLLKHIFKKGIIKYIKENTLVGRFTLFIIRKSRSVMNNLSKIDFNENSNKYLLKLVAINFVIVMFCSLLWFGGIFGAIVYSIVLFFILRKYMSEIKEKYNILLEATNKIAGGNLDVEIKEDLKVFEPLKDELQKIQKGFKNAVDEEVKSQRMKTDLISNVSHDLKTPLTSIITYIDLLKDENISEENRKLYLDTLDRKSQRLKNLIEDLFEVSKATSKNVQLNILNVDIVSLMKQTQFELSDKIEESSLKFKWNFPENKVIVPLDSQKTFRVFENLLINIVKYSMPNSRVFIDIVDGNEEVYVTLKNMSANEIDFTSEEIVERFARGDKSRNTEGSGLGLAIAKSFVELQGGNLNVEIDGDLFKVTLKFKK
ncbi:two-component sensor histidine kinase [Clostridium sartagoforme AAU1]|uniref:histidine kinase n=1 Tax=Clostridium sartagoforme AAU1 TaxID=1202534 RepID=R9BUI4_9CLOT|nr:histidine kinase dimerization/phospho-acceptor domain-containing protein [Clostridium sartagoforme]EOR20789.1 two-component sensor histidine kinase [Clostridium sartagoforme AAU1]